MARRIVRALRRGSNTNIDAVLVALGLEEIRTPRSCKYIENDDRLPVDVFDSYVNRNAR
jgi:hypothetical protein